MTTAAPVRRFEVAFPVAVGYPAGFLEAAEKCFAMFGESVSDFGPTGFSVTFSSVLADPYSANRVLDALVEHVCRSWQAENPTMVMWASNLGFKPVASRGGVVGYELGVFQISCEARRDYAGRNPHNPDAERIKMARRMARRR